MGVTDAERAKIAARHSDIPSDTLERATDITMSLELAEQIAEGLRYTVADLDARIGRLGDDDDEYSTRANLIEYREQLNLIARWLSGDVEAWECRCSWVNPATESRCAGCDGNR